MSSSNRPRNPAPPRGLLTAIACALVLLGGLPASAGDPTDPIRVYFEGSICDQPELDVEVWSRQRERWEPHPIHPRIVADTCQVEDAGTLLNEFRYRCAGPAPGPWYVGVDVFRPGVLEACAGGRRLAARDPLGVRITSPHPGAVVRDDTQMVEIEGAVQIDGRDATGYDLVVAVDVSANTAKPFDASSRTLFAVEIDAVRALLEATAHRTDRLRIGLVSHGGGGARLELSPTTDRSRLLRALDALAARGPSGDPAFAAGLAAGLDAMPAGDALQAVGSGGQRLLLALADGRSALPFGSGLAGDPPYRQRLDDLLERAVRAGVAVHAFALGGPGGPALELLVPGLADSGGGLVHAASPQAAIGALRATPLPQVQHVVIRNRSVDAARIATLRPDGRFRATLPLRNGTNRVQAVATDSSGAEAQVTVEVHFDDSAVRARLLAAERERIRRLRERQRKELRLDPEEAL